jgi:hypothetical protein
MSRHAPRNGRAFPDVTMLLFLLVLLFQSACSSGKAVPTPEPVTEHSGRVHLYRPPSPSIVGIAEVPFVYLDGRKVARLSKGCVLILPVSPGPHEVSLRASFMTAIPTYSLGKVGFDAGRQEEIFLRFIADVDKAHEFGPMPPMTTFLRVREDVGREQSRMLRPCPSLE